MRSSIAEDTFLCCETESTATAVRGWESNCVAVHQTQRRSELITLVSRVRRTRWVLAGDSYQSSSDRRVLFGFPEDDPPKIIEVLWPSAERTTVPIEATDYRRYLTIEEVFAH